MKILLLGAAGFIGTNLTIELAKKTEDEITLVDRSKAFFKPIVSMDLKNVHILEADLTVDICWTRILLFWQSRSLQFRSGDYTGNCAAARMKCR